MRRALLAMIAICVIAGGMTSLAAPPPQTAVGYGAVVDRYRIDPVSGIQQMLAMPDAERERAVRAFAAESELTAERASAAAMLHTDGAVQRFAMNETDAAEAQLRDAETLIGKAIDIDRDFLGLGRRWYHTMAGLLDDGDRKALADEYRKRARFRVLSTPERERAFAALDQGIVFEYAAGTKGQFLTILGLSEGGSNFVDKYLSPATDNFEKALALEPSLHAARLHLARIHMLQDRRSAAMAEFQEAAAAHVPSVRYLAHLFLGADAERRGAGKEAEALYRAALADLPSGQSVYLALAHLYDNRPGGGDANGMLAAFQRRAVRNRLADPWWDYFNVDGIGFDAVTAWRTLRAEVLQ